MTGDARLFADIGERAITIVVEQNASTVLSNIKIAKSVAVIIPDGDALAKATRRHTGLFRYVRERSVAIVSVERIAQRRIRSEKIALAAVHQVNVHPAVIVVIEKCAACT